jgi:hypothetical protein
LSDSAFASMSSNLSLAGDPASASRSATTAARRICQAPVLDQQQPTLAQPGKQRFERGACGPETVGRVVDHEIEALIPELLGEDRPQPLPVGLIDSVEGPHALTQPFPVDQLVERADALLVELDGHELPRPTGQSRQRRAPALHDPELHDVGVRKAVEDREKALDLLPMLADVEAIRLRASLEGAAKLDVADPEPLDPGKPPRSPLLGREPR